MNVAVVAAAGTITDAGTVNAEVTLLERATLEPPVGAALERVTVHVVTEATTKLVLVHCSDAGVAGATSDKLAVALTPFRAAVAVAG